jgi:hypothetical protein
LILLISLAKSAEEAPALLCSLAEETALLWFVLRALSK